MAKRNIKTEKPIEKKEEKIEIKEKETPEKIETKTEVKEVIVEEKKKENTIEKTETPEIQNEQKVEIKEKEIEEKPIEKSEKPECKTGDKNYLIGKKVFVAGYKSKPFFCQTIDGCTAIVYSVTDGETLKVCVNKLSTSPDYNF